MRGLVRVGIAAIVAGLAPLGLAVMSAAPAVPAEVTFTKHIAPILQRSCENCHRPDGVAPMPLVTYEDVRPWARAMKLRTSVGPKAGVMPPWYVEKNIGIQSFHNDPSLSDDEIAMIAKWANSGAPDCWGEIPVIPLGLDEDRYVSAVEIKEINDVDSHAGSGRATVGGRFVFHHMIWRTQVVDPNSDEFPEPLSILTDEEA